MYKVRFNLGKGENYMKWQVTKIETADSPKEVSYYEPENVAIIMRKARLRNQAGAAKKIHEGGNKSTCAWVECEELEIDFKHPKQLVRRELKYNPKIAPYWRGQDEKTYEWKNVDGKRYKELVTTGRGVYINPLSISQLLGRELMQKSKNLYFRKYEGFLSQFDIDGYE